MATVEDELKDLKENNNELAQKVQYWKMIAAERDSEKLALMKENNELRLKLSMLRNNGGIRARKLDEALQQASERSLSLLIKASEEIAKSRELAKEYMRDTQELDAQSPRWSTLGGTPISEKKDRVHRVPPMMMGGQSIQPVVSLSRTMFNTSNPRSATRSTNQSHSLTERARPVHMLLQDAYIPLTRINISDLPNNGIDSDPENDADDSAEELGLDDSDERMDESGPLLDEEEFQGRQLDAVREEEMEELPTPPSINRHRVVDNPLEGPSWLLETRSTPRMAASNSMKLEPDSTTELEVNARLSPDTPCANTQDNPEACAFSPTVRRRKRTSSPAPSPRLHYSPRPPSCRKNSISGRVLKVMVAKMRLEDGASPAKRSLLTFDAPSPNGATDSAVIVSETGNNSIDGEEIPEANTSRNISSRKISYATQRARLNSQDSRERRISQDHETSGRPETVEHRVRGVSQEGRDSAADAQRAGSHDSRDSDSGAGDGPGRVRRPRKMVTYKEKPLNRKLRR